MYETKEGYDYFWRYASKRQEMYWQKISGQSITTDDPILSTYRFTNVYRITDRVSQYLIKEVQANHPWSWSDLFARTLVFKMFNKIETWQFLEQQLGRLDQSSLMNNQIAKALQKNPQPLYNPAYVMPPPRQFKHCKFQRHLELIKLMISDKVPDKLRQAKDMKTGFLILRNYESIGDFLAYQLITDLNYSDYLDFSESEFTVAGPGSLRGLKKCFVKASRLSAPDLIKWTAARSEREFKTRQLPWRNLQGRRLQLIDIQNIFCELDKYTRLAAPALAEEIGKRPKQLYRPNDQPLSSTLPKKWRIPKAQ